MKTKLIFTLAAALTLLCSTAFATEQIVGKVLEVSNSTLILQNDAGRQIKCDITKDTTLPADQELTGLRGKQALIETDAVNKMDECVAKAVKYPVHEGP